jgi:hypothetical protein
MKFIQKYWMAVLVIFAVGASYFATREESINREHALKAALVTACVGDSGRTALKAAGFLTLANRVAARNDPGDAKSAQEYRALVAGIIDLIPAPFAYRGNRKIIEVRLVSYPGELPSIVITKRAKDLQLAGCKEFYGVR